MYLAKTFDELREPPPRTSDELQEPPLTPLAAIRPAHPRPPRPLLVQNPPSLSTFIKENYLKINESKER